MFLVLSMLEWSFENHSKIVKDIFRIFKFVLFSCYIFDHSIGSSNLIVSKSCKAIKLSQFYSKYKIGDQKLQIVSKSFKLKFLIVLNKNLKVLSIQSYD